MTHTSHCRSMSHCTKKRSVSHETLKKLSEQSDEFETDAVRDFVIQVVQTNHDCVSRNFQSTI